MIKENKYPKTAEYLERQITFPNKMRISLKINSSTYDSLYNYLVYSFTTVFVEKLENWKRETTITKFNFMQVTEEYCKEMETKLNRIMTNEETQEQLIEKAKEYLNQRRKMALPLPDTQSEIIAGLIEEIERTNKLIEKFESNIEINDIAEI